MGLRWGYGEATVGYGGAAVGYGGIQGHSRAYKGIQGQSSELLEKRFHQPNSGGQPFVLQIVITF